MPLTCKCKVAAETPAWAHALSCNLGGVANTKHNDLARVWFEFLRRCGVNVTVDGEYKPFGTDDDRRVDGAVAGLPDTVWEMMLDFTLTSVANATGVARGKDTDLGAAAAAEDGKRQRHSMARDLVNAGMGFIPVAHELTGALGPSARDELFVPALAVLKKNKLGAAARAALAGEGGEEPAPWNARSVRANALQQFGLAVARGVGLAATHSRRAGRRHQ